MANVPREAPSAGRHASCSLLSKACSVLCRAQQLRNPRVPPWPPDCCRGSHLLDHVDALLQDVSRHSLVSGPLLQHCLCQRHQQRLLRQAYAQLALRMRCVSQGGLVSCLMLDADLYCARQSAIQHMYPASQVGRCLPLRRCQALRKSKRCCTSILQGPWQQARRTAPNPTHS